ncbi:hypothetical protein ACHAXA_004240 [Cyclostephanos tholiformis]|uniref:Uncharacterized protein n=1 Tax=Cyclostephanos tholiformis TaxID=382380 RepID=A0ABD3R9R7_9STRA
MFVNKPSSSSAGVLSNNENAAVHRATKSIIEKGTKKSHFNDENVKTPHRGNKDASIAGKGGQQTAQRRRRAFGQDISNRGQAGGEAGGKGDLSSKQTSTKPGKVTFPSTSTANRASQVAHGKVTFVEGKAANRARLGGESVARGADVKQYDGAVEVTTRWASDDAGEKTRSPFDLVPEEELYMVSKFRDESSDLRRKEVMERDKLELERCEELFMEQIRAVGEIDDCEICGDESSTWNLLYGKLPWEEEDGKYDPAEERRLSGSDPFSLWGDVLNY